VIQISRSLARQIRVMNRHLAGRGSAGARSLISFRTSGEGLRIRIHDPALPVEYREEGSYAAEALAVSAEALAEFEGRDASIVVLDTRGPGTIDARWSDAGIPRTQVYDSPGPEQWPAFPEAAQNLTAQEPGFLKALDHASHVTDRAPMRYATNQIQLKPPGDIAATDGRHLLVQSGFAFPWTDSLLIPATSAFGFRGLPIDAPTALGKTDTHLTLRIGPWTFHLPVDTTSRFPAIDQVVPKIRESTTYCRIDQEDADFLARALPRLPVSSEEEEKEVVTVDLNGHVAIRARAKQDGQPTELVLARSQVLGQPVRFCTNRTYLARALQLGFREFYVPSAESPALAQDKQRKYVWMLLGSKGAIAPSADTLCIRSQPLDQAASATPDRQPQHERNKLMTSPSTNGDQHKTNGEMTENKPVTGPIEEAQALQAVLKEALCGTQRLIASIRRQRKQARLLQTTLASLRQLQRVEA